MSFRQRIKYFLIHVLNYTNKSANELISSGKITVNGKIIFTNELLMEDSEMKLNGLIIHKKPTYNYFALYKPVGIESTFDIKRKDNLASVFPFDDTLFVAGRLDKASEGLLLISNDGKWVNSITKDDAFKEKEYEVETENPINNCFIEELTAGVDIGFYTTRPCKAYKTGNNSFNIILTEGKNKQIRRMCKKLGKKVITLKRVRIDKYYLSDLKPLEYKKID